MAAMMAIATTINTFFIFMSVCLEVYKSGRWSCLFMVVACFDGAKVHKKEERAKCLEKNSPIILVSSHLMRNFAPS
jgi:hypothetical protein